MTTQILRGNMLSMKVCVPKTHTDEQVLKFAAAENPCGAESGWQIRRVLDGTPERVACDFLPAHVHIMLDC